MLTSRLSVVRKLLGLSVLLASLLLTACNNSDSGTINSDETGATTMAFSPPAVISQSRIASDDLMLEILVDGTAVPLSRNEAGQWVGTTMVPSNSNVEVIVNWSEDLAVYVNGPLLLATATKELNVAAGATSAQLTFLNSEFDTSIDTDGDGRSNLAERNDNFDPLDDDSPGVAITTVPVRISLELPASLSDAPEATKQAITATASLNGQQITLTREGDLWMADTFAAENSSVFVSATFYDSSQLGSRLAVVQRSQDIAGAATLLFFANDYSSTFDDDSDGLSNALEVTNGSNPKDSNSPAREPCDISQFTIGCTTDTDEDGKPDSQETAAADSDGDGIPNYRESTLVDADSDGRSEEADADDDDPCVPTVNASACQATLAPTWVNGTIVISGETDTSLTASWSGARHGVGVTSYEVTYTGGGVTDTVVSTSTSTVLTGLEPETTYTITVEARDATGKQSTTGPDTTGTTDEPAPVPDTTAPTWTGGGSATVSGETETSMMVSWSGATDAVGVTSYEVTYTGGGATDTVASTSTSTVLTGLEPETTYTITIEALDAAGNESTTGPDTTGTTDEPAPVPDTTAPTWTGGGSASVSGETETSMMVSWSGATDAVGVTSYEVTYTGGGATDTVVSTSTSTVLTGLEPETTYTITIEALDAAGNESTTGPDTTGTTDEPAPVPDTTAPTWTGGGSASVSGETETSMMVSWSGATDAVGVTSYEVTYTGGGATDTVASTSTSTVLTGLEPETTYTITIEALDAAGNESTTGPDTTGTTEAAIDATAPTWMGTASATVNNETDTSMRVRWVGATDDVGVTGYEVTYTGGGVTNTALSSTSSELLTGLDPDTDYSITIEAFDAAGNESTTGPSVIGTTEAAIDATAPTWTAGELMVNAITETSVTLSWSGASDAEGVTSYLITYDGVGSTGSALSTTTNITISTLIADTEYTFTVEARDDAGNESTDGPSVMDTTDAVDPDPDETPPTWTAGIATLDNITETSATVSWSGATDDIGVVDYTLNYDDGDESTGTTFSTTLTATLQGLLPGTSYTFTVRARDAAGNSSGGDSPTVEGTTDETGA